MVWSMRAAELGRRRVLSAIHLGRGSCGSARYRSIGCSRAGGCPRGAVSIFRVTALAWWARHPRPAAQPAPPEGRLQPLVRIERDGIGLLDAGATRSHGAIAGAGDAAVDMQPLAGNRRLTQQAPDRAGIDGAGTGDDESRDCCMPSRNHDGIGERSAAMSMRMGGIGPPGSGLRGFQAQTGSPIALWWQLASRSDRQQGSIAVHTDVAAASTTGFSRIL